MKKIIISISVVSLLEILICGLNLFTIIALVGRLLFLGKLIGMKITLSKLVGFEATAFGLYILYPILFSKRIALLKLLAFVVCALLVLIIEWYDDANYVYTEEEEL